ncbi:electron transfer flavoprotein subunit beta/FixA family protein [Vibrio sp. ZSDE26]|uniref:Electron transfer flavoprotein subunit beta n=1 Tax=Vibrio amylolyticus TaxID=2847292 RepID=A0A9X1XI41_9VIBR|nr:electron transfer flavoprotein subunit beta/FixA family protein [Vibrio amylolyticus]
MKVLVSVKRVVDPYVKVRVKQDGTGVETANVKMTINPFCEIAVEEAIRLKEAGIADEVTVVSIGDKSCQEQLRTALALGADKAIHIDTSENQTLNQNLPMLIEPLTVAKGLKSLVDLNGYDLVLLGKQSIDSDNNQVAQMLAALMQRPQATFASKLDVKDRTVQVVREIDGGLETIKLQLPAVISTDLRLNEPRYASLPNIMKAKRKPMDVTTLEELGVEVSSHQSVLEITNPPIRQGGTMVNTVSELVDRLKNDVKVL